MQKYLSVCRGNTVDFDNNIVQPYSKYGKRPNKSPTRYTQILGGFIKTTREEVDSSS
jgi:hypothetical protein